VDTLVLNLDSVDVIIGDTTRLTAVATDADGNPVPGVRLSYSSSDPNVATVDDQGLVTAVDLGEAEIEVAIADGGSAGATAADGVELSAAMLRSGRSRARIWSVPRVVITPGEQTVDPGATSQYSARITNRSDQQLRNRPETRWSSSSASVAGVDQSGLVTALQEGDTWITATVTVGRAHQYHTSVRLHVVVCGGIFKVAEWDATATASYAATGSWQQSNYSVNQSSTGRARLKLVGTADGGVATWEGTVTGTATLNNQLTFPKPGGNGTAVTSENKSGPIENQPTSFFRLQVVRSSDEHPTCSYSIRYGDFLFWNLENNQGAPPSPYAGPIGIAQVVSQPVGTRPSGTWTLSGNTPVPAGIFLGGDGDGGGGDDDLPALPKSSYNVGSVIGIALVTAVGTRSNPTYGNANVQYSVTAR
jgi:hypothetical protein